MKWFERLIRRSKPESAEDLRKIQADTLRNIEQRKERERQEFHAKSEAERIGYIQEAQKRNATVLSAACIALGNDLYAAAARGENRIKIAIEADTWATPTRDEVASLPEFKKLQSLCASRGYRMEFKVQHTPARSWAAVGGYTPAYDTTYLEVRF